MLLLGAFVGLSLMAGSPRDAYGMVHYAFPHMHRGKLKVGDDVPDARLVALDGAERFHIWNAPAESRLFSYLAVLPDRRFAARLATSRKFTKIISSTPTSSPFMSAKRIPPMSGR